MAKDKEVILNTIFQLKRGTKARWEALNPILRDGEPGFVLDTNLLKIGDGMTAWNDLPFIEGSNEVETVYSVENLPSVGNPLILYRVITDKALYQYDENTGNYVILNPGCEGVKTIKAAGSKLEMDNNGAVDIPAATKNNFGLTKGTDKFAITEGIVEKISTDLLSQGENDIVFSCGGAE